MIRVGACSYHFEVLRENSKHYYSLYSNNYLLGSMHTLNMGSDLYQNRHFLRQEWTEIRFLVQPQQVNHNDRASNLLRDG